MSDKSKKKPWPEHRKKGLGITKRQSNATIRRVVKKALLKVFRPSERKT